MSPNLMRLAWSVVDQTVIPQRQSLTLGEQIKAVLSEIDNRAVLSPHERQHILQYLVSRQHLLQALYQ